jgi:hypothetical protein
MSGWSQTGTAVGTLNLFCVEGVDKIFSLAFTPSRNLSNVFLYTDTEFLGLVSISGEGTATWELPVWEPEATSSMGKSASPAIYYNGKIYIWGDAITLDGRMLIYDIASKTFSFGANAGVYITNHCGALYNGNIYYFGGWEASGYTEINFVTVYNIAGNSFSTASATFPSPCVYDASAVTYGTKIYISGGSPTAETYEDVPTPYVISDVNSSLSGWAPNNPTTFLITQLDDGSTADINALSSQNGAIVTGITLTANSACDVEIKLFTTTDALDGSISATCVQNSSVHHNGSGAQTFTVNWTIPSGTSTKYFIGITTFSNPPRTAFGYTGTTYLAYSDVDGTDNFTAYDTRPYVSINYSININTQVFAVPNLLEYDPTLDSFTALTDMNTARQAHVSFAIGTNLYCIGGTDKLGAPIPLVEVYSLTGTTWSDGGEDPGIAYCAGFTHSNKAYIWGGDGNTNFYCYDPSISDLSILCTMEPTLSLFGMIINESENVYAYAYSDPNLIINTEKLSTIIANGEWVSNIEDLPIGGYSLTPTAYLGNLTINIPTTIALKLNFTEGLFLGEQIIPIRVGYGDNVVAP